VPVIRLSKLATWRRARRNGQPCRWAAKYRWLREGEPTPPPERVGRVGRYGVTTVIERYYWSCTHERGCTRCGKILDHSLPDAECPDFDANTRPVLP
jgi:hypothetical protein